MAKTRVKPAHDIAKGNAPDTGSPGPTPAPTRPAAPDVISAPRRATAAGYGMNSDSGPVSLSPGMTRQSPLADNLRASVDDDGVLDRVQRQGTARVDDSITSQLRSIGDKNVPDHPAMASARSRQPTYPGPKSATLPATTGKSDAQPRKP
jgi:hypothetical protein